MRIEIAHSNRQSPVGTRKHVEDLPATEEVLTIIGGTNKIGGSHNTRDRYAKEAKNLPMALVHKADIRPI